MRDKIYTIKEASELLELESHTLRYYEDELELVIPRNSMGHRYYREYDINLFKHIMQLKDQGLQLKAIKESIQGFENELVATTILDTSSKQVVDITDINNKKVQQFQLMMKETFLQAISENQEELKSQLNNHIESRVKAEIKDEIQRLENVYDEKDKERYRKLDETMREMQKIRKEMIESREEKYQKKTLFGKIFGKKLIKEKEYNLEE